MCDYVYNARDMCWEFYFDDKLVVSISQEYVHERRDDMYSLVSSMEAFKMLVGEWLLSCVEGTEKDFATKAWLTKMSRCAIH